MITLQKTFKYKGSLADIPFSKVELQFVYPNFNYSPAGPNEPFILRQSADGGTTVTLSHDLGIEDYQVKFPSEALTGTADNARLFLSYIIQCMNQENPDLDGLAASIAVNMASENDLPLKNETFNAIYLIKNLSKLLRLQFSAPSQGLATFLEKNLYLINKDVYDEILLEFKHITNVDQELALFNIIQKLVEVTNLDPSQPFNLNQDIFDRLPEIIREQHIENIEVVNEFIKKHFARLFDFPIVLEEIKMLNIGGTFHVNTSDGSSISNTDLFFYDLSLEYSTANNAGGPQIIHINWSAIANTLDNNAVNFSFTTIQPVILNGISGLITSKVKGFDGSELWLKQFKPEDPSLKELRIEVDLLRPNVLNPQGTKGKDESGKKLRGQLVGLTKKCPLKDVTVVIQAKKEGDENWQVVAAATTDNPGNFSMPYPYGVYIAAQALISLTPDSPADIPINTGNQENQTISDSFLYLLVTDPICDEEKKEGDDDCDCHAVKKAPRLPDQADLINSDEYTQDIGGSCINLSTPNRTLSEYNYQGIVRTSDPDVANYTLRKITRPSGPFGISILPVGPIDTRFELVGGTAKIKRSAVDLNNPIQWQDAPDSQENLSLYQAVTVATGHILHYKSEFKADGYSLGNLIYSLPLAPGQKKQIVVIDSQHSLFGSETQDIVQSEKLSANLVNERGITDQLSGSLNEAMQGQSTASTSGVSAGLGLGASVGVLSGALGVAGGYANSNSSASQDSSRNTAQYFGERLRQSIMQNADSYRRLNASVVTTVEEGQHYAATTEVVANHNHCHALTMMYFEVLRHYAIFQELVNVEECVFVPLLMTNFTVDNIYKWKDVLAQALLPMHSSTYLQPFGFLRLNRQHPLLKAFDANERIKTNYAEVDFPAGRYCDEAIITVSGSIAIHADLPRPTTRFDRVLSLPIISKTVTEQGGVDVGGTIKDNIKSSVLGAVTGGLSFLFGGGPSVKYSTVSHEVLTPGQIFDNFMTLDANYESVPPAKSIRVHNFNPLTILVNGEVKIINFFDGNTEDQKIWDAYAAILGIDIYELMNKFSGNVISDWDSIFYSTIGPLIIAKLINEDTLSIKPLSSFDLTSLNSYSARGQLLRYNIRANTTSTRAQITELDVIYKFNAAITPDEITTLNQKVHLDVESLVINYSTDHYNGRIYNGYVGNDLLDNATIPTPMNFDEKRNPRKEDIFIVKKLIEHLNSNLEHYNKSLWYNLDIDRRYMLLDGFNIQIYNDFGMPDGFRSLASVVKNQLITVTGNSLVFPVAAGYRVSQSYIVAKNEDGEAENVTLFDHYKPLTPIPPYRISVPSRGVFLEAVQGACDACEKIKENSAQDWTKFTADEPTPIASVTPPVPTITDWKAAFKDFATPLINIQNAPATPDPGAGLAGLSDLLGKSGIFKDITGLDANQQNVIRTYLSNQENAKAFAEMAKTMAMQGHNTQNSDKIMDSLKTAKDSGAISQDDYGKLVKEHIQKQIDGGESEKTALEQQKSSKPTLTDAAVKAADQGKDVKAQKTDTDGNSESVEIKGNKSDSALAKVNGSIPKLKQENDMACWATAATMMVSWKQGKTLTVPQVLALAGDVYVEKFNNKEGLMSTEKEAFITALGMIGEAPASYPLQQYVDWLNAYGPLWITTDSSADDGQFSPHARILTTITGTGSADGNGTNFIFNDPATGTEKSETFTAFISAFEQMVTDNPGDLFIQIVHFEDAVSSGEGAPAVVDPRKTINEFTPAAADTLIINMKEFNTGITNFSNFLGSKTDTKIKHNTIWNKTPIRKPENITQIVIHETGADGVNDPAFLSPNTAHLAVLRNNTVKQFNDLVEFENHAGGFNGNSIGIEFSNLAWDQAAPASNTNLPAKYSSDTDYLKLFWGVGYNIYRLPSKDQLEKLVELVDWLTNFNNPPDGVKPSFDLTWHQLVSFNDVSSIYDFGTTVVADDKKADKQFFIMTKAHFYVKPSKLGNAGGIVCHANLVRDDDFITPGDHVDGSFPSLYVWLRLGKKLDKDKAYSNATNLMKNFKLKLTTKSNIKRYAKDDKVDLKEDTKRPVFVLDVSSGNFI